MLGKDLSKGRHCSYRSKSGPGPEGAALCEDGRMDALQVRGDLPSAW